MIPLAIVSIFPVWWMFVTSLRPENDSYSSLPWPGSPTLDSYTYAMNSIAVWPMLRNTALYAVTSTLAQMLTAVLAAWAFVRWRFPLDRFVRALIALIALTWLVPFQVVMIPN